mgnify:FL=1
MIICADFCGQLGNHILTMNNLIQLSELLKVPYQNNSNIIQKYFDVKYNKYKDRDNFTSYSTLLNSRQLVKIFDNEPKFILDNLLDYSKKGHIVVTQPFLGELFFRYNVVNPNDFIQLKPQYMFNSYTNSNDVIIGIHIRDMGSWNNRHEGVSDLKPSYYINSIKHCLENKEELCSINKKNNLLFILVGATSNKQSTLGEKCDVSNYPPYIESEKFLKENNIKYEYGTTTKYPIQSCIYDWSQLSECDVIISSAGTFAISAGIFGKQNKKIIHSKEWVEYAANKYDTFWKDLYDGGNEYYKLWKLI